MALAPSVNVLTPEQQRYFRQNGYLHLKGLHGPREVELLRQRFHQMITKPEGQHRTISYGFADPVPGYETDPFNPRNLTGMMNHVAVDDFWFDHMTDPRIVGAMADLLGPNIDFHNGKVRNKPPGFTCVQSWHQDFPYERHTAPDLAAAITYLEQTDLNAGATEVVPGSHLKGEWPTKADGVTIDESLVEEGSWEVCRAQPGDVILIHVLLVHRAGHNHTNTSRHAIINEYKTHEVRDIWGNQLAYANLPLARQGRPLLPRLTDQWKELHFSATFVPTGSDR